MDCPFCSVLDTKVIDSRLIREGNQIRRRRECLVCQERFTTYERIEWTLPRVIKRDGRHDVFDENKLRAGMLRALERRPISLQQIDAALARIIRQAQAYGEREVSSSQVGQWVMDELQNLDQVAFVRFASVYRSFQDINEFKEEVTRLKEHKNT